MISTPCGRLQISHLNGNATVDGMEVHLTPLESRLLSMLTARSPAVVARKELIAYVWEDYEYMPERLNSLHNLVSRLNNRKLWTIKSQPWIGYWLEVGA